MNAHNTAIFAAILETRSMTVIQYTLEEEIIHTSDNEDRALMQKMRESNSLDEIWIMCHKRIAEWHTHCANAIQAFLDNKRGKNDALTK